MTLHHTRRKILILTASVFGAAAGCLGTPGTSETATQESPATSTDLSARESSTCRKTPVTRGTAVYEAAPPDLSVENTTTVDHTVNITVTRLPDDVTLRPPDKAPHQILDLSKQSTVFAKTIELSASSVKVYRCTDMNSSSGELQVAVDVQNGPVGAYDWRPAMGPLNIGLKESLIEFSTQGR